MCTPVRLYHSLARSTTLFGTLILFGLILVLPAWSDYQRTGPMIGTVCTGFGLVCQSNVPIVAFKDTFQGKTLYVPMETSFPSVDSYNASSQTCHIRLNRGIWTPLNWLIGKLKNPDLYTREDGQLKKVEPESVRFKCVKRN